MEISLGEKVQFLGESSSTQIGIQMKQILTSEDSHCAEQVKKSATGA